MYLKSALEDKYAVMMNLTEQQKNEMTYMDAIDYADLAFSERFEGI